jgi:hypothetical protein
VRLSTLVLIAGLPGVFATLSAQCTGSASVQGVCNRAIDALKTFHPAAGIIVSGGDPSLGTAQALGGFGHFFVSARVNAVNVAAPNPDTTNVSNTIHGFVPAPVVEAGVGIWPGLRGMLAVDALFAATLVPTHAVDKLTVDSGAAHFGSMALGLGYGVRVGVFNGMFPIPAVSVSVMRRSLPRLTYGQLAASSLSSGDAFQFATDVKATNVRVTAGYHLLLADVAAGFGFDHYSSNGRLRYYDNPPFNSIATVPFTPRNNRAVVFADAAFHLALASLGAEVGYQTGEDQHLSTNYSGFNAKSGHIFGGVGVRVGF